MTGVLVPTLLAALAGPRGFYEAALSAPASHRGMGPSRWSLTKAGRQDYNALHWGWKLAVVGPGTTSRPGVGVVCSEHGL